MYRVTRAFRLAGTPRFLLGVLLSLGLALCARADDKAAWAWFWSGLGEQKPSTPADAAWAWASVPPCKCGGKEKDCPCAAAKKADCGMEKCACGCKKGQTCTCAADARQAKAYGEFCDRMLARGGKFAVFVGLDAPWGFQYPAVRWDRYPDAKPGTLVWCQKIGEELYEIGRSEQQVGCPDGKCKVKK